MRILAIDPGPEKSGVVLIDVYSESLLSYWYIENTIIPDNEIGIDYEYVVFEKPMAHKKKLSTALRNTIYWYGRLYERFHIHTDILSYSCQEIRRHFGNGFLLQEKEVNQILKERFPVEFKKLKGPHLKDAFALAVYVMDKKEGV